MPIDGTLNPSATYVEQNNQDHALPGGLYQVRRGFLESWALTDPLIYPRQSNPFITNSQSDTSNPAVVN